MADTTKTSYPQQVQLRGFERAVTLADNISVKIVHSMLVAGDTESLLQLLPVALTRTFNMHPRMRALQVKDEDFTAKIQAPIKLDTIFSENLLRIRRFSQSTSTECTFKDWHLYVEYECSVAIDRYAKFPFFLTVWIDDAVGQARLMLFSDHYMWDGYSGMVVLNCILEQIASHAKESGRNEVVHAQEFPLRATLCDRALSEMWLVKPLLKAFVSLFRKTIYQCGAKVQAC